MKKNYSNRFCSCRMTLILGFFLSCFFTNAQAIINTTTIGIATDRYIAGNPLGTFYSLQVNISKRKNNFFAGPVMQERSQLINGARVGYSRILSGEPGTFDCEGMPIDTRFQINCFSYIQYTDALPLSYKCTIVEERCNRQADYNWNKLRLTTIEMAMGFEFRVRITKSITWKNYFGASIYNILNYKQGMYHEKVAPVMLLGTGIQFNLFKL